MSSANAIAASRHFSGILCMIPLLFGANSGKTAPFLQFFRHFFHISYFDYTYFVPK
jgi:hypothetical protein